MHTNRNPNHLIHSKSPYLLQHAYNPVDWLEWGTEAFAKAKNENKPIFLSIGYSTCHWCHVMADESFEDDTVAEMLNTNFIAIKVDREERPDIDAVYMKVCQMMTGQGGWPLTIFMTPDQVPFYAGTYFPKESKYGMPGLKDALTQLHDKYTQDPDHIQKVTESVTQALQQTIAEKNSEKLTTDTVKVAVDQLQSSFDPKYGGFGSAPKFPAPQNLLFLMRHYKFTGDETSLQMTENTLQGMAAGGIYDHIGFGFSRYSTDKTWLVPHFEKMLYDNALLLMAFTECYQITKKDMYQHVAEQIIQFISREMTSPDGAFYSAIDADSEGVEGKYYVWSYEEIIDMLGEDLGEMFASVYNITPYGNFEGNNIPNLIGTNKQTWMSEYNLSADELDNKLEKARSILLETREQRVYPHVDDKQLTGWNALMIAALAKAGWVFNRPDYTNRAKKALTFIEKNLFQGGRLMARYRNGEVKHRAYLDDYSFLLWAYTALYDTTFDPVYLQQARHTADQMIQLFWDNDDGGFYFNGHDSEMLISREKEVFEGALPSGNSVAAVMFTRLSSLTGDMSYQEKVETMYASFYKAATHYAAGVTHFLQSMLLSAYPTKEVVVLGAKNDPDRNTLLEELQEHFLPGVTLLVGETADDLSNNAPFTAEYHKLKEETTVYVCEHFTCKQPTTDINKVIQMIKE